MSMSSWYTLGLSAIIGASVLPFLYRFGVVVCLEGGLSSRRLLVDGVAVWVAEYLRTYCSEEHPYRYCQEHMRISTRQELQIDWTYSR